MKNLKTFLLENKDKTEEKDGKRKILKVKNKIIMNPDFSTYQAKTHKDSDRAVPLDDINTNGKSTNATPASSSGS